MEFSSVAGGGETVGDLTSYRIIYIIIMIEVQMFKFNVTSAKCYMVNGEPWFRGKDVASKLEYSNTKKAISDHVDIEDKKKL